MKLETFMSSLAGTTLLAFTVFALPAAAETTQLNFALIGDSHGHLLPRPNLRRDAQGRVQEGGYARLVTAIKRIQAEDPDTVTLMSGDTLQGGVENLYTAGQVAVDVFDTLGIDAFAPGNWDYLYGSERFVEVFGDDRWGVVAANVYFKEDFEDPATRQRLVDPYRILEVKGVKIGVIGMSAERGILAVPGAIQDLVFQQAADELPTLVPEVDAQVDVLILLSEMGLAKNTLVAEDFPQFDFILSSDMHEETPNPVQVGDTLVAEFGQDGSAVGQLRMMVEDGEVVDKQFTWTDVNMKIPPDRQIASMVKAARAEFSQGPDFQPHVNPVSGYELTIPADTIVGNAEVPLWRAAFTDDPNPGVVEGTSHNLITDAFREQTGADAAMIVGFRYGDHIPKGPIELRDLYHYLPAGAQIARGTVKGQMILNLLENQLDGALNKDPFRWTGGWIFGWSGLMFEADMTLPKGERVMNVKIQPQGGAFEPIDPTAEYTLAGWWFPEIPERVGVLLLEDVEVLTQDGFVPPENVVPGIIKDATEVVMDYLASHPADTTTGRVRLLSELPPPVFDNPEVQPLRGATLE